MEKKDKCPVSITHAKLMKVVSLSVDEVGMLYRMKEEKDVDGIKNFFTSSAKCCLHDAGFNLIRCDDYVLIFGSHAFLDKNLIVVAYENKVYEFTSKRNSELFLGCATNTIYSQNTFPFFGAMENPRPVEISFSFERKE